MNYEIVAFLDQSAFRQWLVVHGATTPGIWLRLYKKASGVTSITYAEALDEALCFGWIDGQKKSYDNESFLQKFTPRRAKSLWSKRNIEHVARLTQAGMMTPAGLKEVESAQADGRWSAAYDGAATMQLPEEFLTELNSRPHAKAVFESLNKTNKYAIAWRLHTAKTEETRKNRLAKIVAMLEAGEKFH